MAIMIVFSAFAKDEPNIPADNPNPSCDNNTLKTTSGSVSLVANWTPESYSCSAGQYLDASDAECKKCPENYYCEGFTDQTFNNSDIGKTSCSNAPHWEGYGNETFLNSESGAVSGNWCYDSKTTTCAVKNRYYFGHGTPTYATTDDVACRIYTSTNADNAEFDHNCTLENVSDCEMTLLTCDAGYHLSGTTGALANYVNENTSMDSEFQTYRSKVGAANGGIDKGDISNLNPGEWKDVWYDGTWVKGISTCNNQPTPLNTIMIAGAAWQTDEMSQEDFLAAISDVTTDEQFTKVMDIFQKMLSNTITLADASNLLYYEFAYGDLPQQNFSADSAGAYCWCKMTQYSIAGGLTQTADSALWVSTTGATDELTDDSCSKRCARSCAERIKSNAMHRNMLFGELGEHRKCEPNTINLNWNAVGNVGGETGLQFANDGGGMCTYDGIITLPTPPTKTGYTFNGWNVSVVEQSDVPQDPEPQQPKP